MKSIDFQGVKTISSPPVQSHGKTKSWDFLHVGLEEIVNKLSSGGGSASERRVIQKRPSWSYELPSSFPSIENLYPMTDPCMYAMIMVCHLPSIYPRYVCKYSIHGACGNIYHQYMVTFTINKNPRYVGICLPAPWIHWPFDSPRFSDFPC